MNIFRKILLNVFRLSSFEISMTISLDCGSGKNLKIRNPEEFFVSFIHQLQTVIVHF